MHWFDWLKHHRRAERDLDREIQGHLELEMEDQLAGGLSEEEARQAANRALGNVMYVKESTREMWGSGWFERLRQDLKYAVRTFGRSPGFVVVAMLSLALGIGATTALFSVVYGVVIAPYPYARPNEIWAPAVTGPKEVAQGWHQYSRREYLEITKLPVFSAAMATDPQLALMTGERSPESVTAVTVTGGAFDFMGVRPLIGRTIQPFDVGPGGEPQPVVVISYKFWQRIFGGRNDALGAKVVLNDVPHTVIGVMPPRFGWWTSDGLWRPMNMDLKETNSINAIVRLAPGVTAAAAAQSLQQLNQQFALQNRGAWPKGDFRTVLLNYMDITVASGELTSSLMMLIGAVGCLLLIACVNVANLQLARTTARMREVAMRLSIGASRARIIRQLLTENLVLSVAGGVTGLLLAVGLTRAIVGLMPEFYVPNEARIGTNIYVLAFSFGVSVLTGVLFGLAPAIQCSNPNLTDTLKDGSRGSGGSRLGRRIRGFLVAAEVTLSVVLLAGATLAIRSFADLMKADPGFHADRTLMVNVPLPPKQYKTLEQRNILAENLLERVKNLPGVTAVAMGNGAMPFGGPRSAFRVEGTPDETGRTISVALISADYPRTMGIALKQGRGLSEAEVTRGDHFALINETAAKLWKPGESPLGRRISIELLAKARGQALLPATPSGDLIIVGILGDVRNDGLRNATLPSVFVPFTLVAPPNRVLAVRTVGEPMAILNTLRRTVQELDKQLPLSRPISLDEVLGSDSVQPRFSMALLSCFAGLGLALAAAGIYSVISYDVAQKIHEIGVRVALGAGRKEVVILVLGKAARLVGAGLAVGLAGSLALERIIRFKVFGSATLDFAMVAEVSMALMAVALLAVWYPARRAAGMHPVDALRQDG
ncbi:MAG TPA: ABC transporter permease [Bryobacteraceae bacterium]|nr:ABC transporter permease [Bryobacteraceae bacterium]